MPPAPVIPVRACGLFLVLSPSPLRFFFRDFTVSWLKIYKRPHLFTERLKYQWHPTTGRPIGEIGAAPPKWKAYQTPNGAGIDEPSQVLWLII